MEKNNYILTGIKHCGKSTQGKILSENLNIPFYDTDDVIEEMTGLTARQIFSEKGEGAFKNAEAEACKFILEKKEPGHENITWQRFSTLNAFWCSELGFDLNRYSQAIGRELT